MHRCCRSRGWNSRTTVQRYHRTYWWRYYCHCKVMADVETIKTDVANIMSACNLGHIYGFSGTCQDDINGIVTTIQAIGADIQKLVGGDISVVSDIISKAQSLVGQLQTAVSDCL